MVYVGQPLDTVKVKMQTFPHLYKGMYHCLKQTLRNDGVFRGLYAGTTPAIMANVAENSVLFAAYGYCQKFVCQISGVEVIIQSVLFKWEQYGTVINQRRYRKIGLVNIYLILKKYFSIFSVIKLAFHSGRYDFELGQYLCSSKFMCQTALKHFCQKLIFSLSVPLFKKLIVGFYFLYLQD